MKAGFRNMAQRIENAANEFVASVREQFGTTADEAEKVLRVFRKAKAVKLDPIGGRYLLQHGAFWESDVIRRAIELDERGLPCSKKR